MFIVFDVCRCEAKCSLDDFEVPRTALVLSPYFSSDVGSLDQIIISLDGVESLRKDTVTRAWHSLVDSCISALAAGVASSDFQYLVDIQGHTLILDLTEARILRFASSSSSSIVEGATSTSNLLGRELELEQQLARSFLGELRSNMPTSLGESGQVYLSKVISEKLSNKPFFRFLFEE